MRPVDANTVNLDLVRDEKFVIFVKRISRASEIVHCQERWINRSRAIVRGDIDDRAPTKLHHGLDWKVLIALDNAIGEYVYSGYVQNGR